MSGEVICLDGGLFPEPVRDVRPPDTRTPAERRLARQLEAIAHGQHPLSVALRVSLPLHPAARRDGDRADDGSPRCSGCRFCRRLHGGNRSYPKCAFGGHPFRRATHGTGTDLTAWFPACSTFERIPRRDTLPKTCGNGDAAAQRTGELDDATDGAQS